MASALWRARLWVGWLANLRVMFMWYVRLAADCSVLCY
ncbi:hypothetical protein PF001_g6739 [Phytophthora fragariae]|uniref:Uncharacterized protein n=1 Tax=Phytophthora fragariae TaxID=53985 RepID=A0A6A4E0U2_9STRA|nr:hypothetical protein PF006_g6378 [Phytophthora fragariae]KAE9317690.1 hypothetical protein PF001_g6739 [Phytophthora fragariae]